MGDEYIDYEDVQTLVTIEADLGGDIYEISVARDLNMGGFENAVNTISMKIAFMEKVAAACWAAYENCKAELTVLEAEIDEKVRAIRGMRGEQRIMRHIQRNPSWLKKKYVVNEANANYLAAKGAVDAYKSFDRMLEVKSNNMRKFPEMREQKAFFTKKKFFIRKSAKLIEDDEIRKPKRKRIKLHKKKEE